MHLQDYRYQKSLRYLIFPPKCRKAGGAAEALGPPPEMLTTADGARFETSKAARYRTHLLKRRLATPRHWHDSAFAPPSQMCGHL